MNIQDRINGLNSGLAIKVPCRMATTAAITLSGLQTIDGIAGVEGDRICVKNQSDATQNGIWEMSTGAWTRPADFDGPRDAVNGTLVLIRQGTVNEDVLLKLTAADPVVFGSSSITFSRAGYVTEGDIQEAAIAAAEAEASALASSQAAADAQANAQAIADLLESLTLGPSQAKNQIFVDGVGYDAGTDTTITITDTPIPLNENSLTIDFDGVIVPRDTWSYNNTTGVVTFSSPIPVDVGKIQANWWTTLSIGVPADNSVNWLTKMIPTTPKRIPYFNDSGNPGLLVYKNFGDLADTPDIPSEGVVKAYVDNNSGRRLHASFDFNATPGQASITIEDLNEDKDYLITFKSVYGSALSDVRMFISNDGGANFVTSHQAFYELNYNNNYSALSQIANFIFVSAGNHGTNETTAMDGEMRLTKPNSNRNFVCFAEGVSVTSTLFNVWRTNGRAAVQNVDTLRIYSQNGVFNGGLIEVWEL